MEKYQRLGDGHLGIRKGARLLWGMGQFFSSMWMITQFDRVKTTLFLEIGLLVVGATCVFSACTMEKPQAVAHSKALIPLQIDLKDHQLFSFRQFFDTLYYIPLGGYPDLLLGEVDKISITTHYIFILDRPLDEITRVSVFRKDGSFVRSYTSASEGPQRLVQINDFDFDEQKEHLYLLSRFERKIAVYDLDGHLRTHYFLPSMFRQMVAVPTRRAAFWLYADNVPLAVSTTSTTTRSVTDTGCTYNLSHILSNENLYYVDLDQCTMYGWVPINESLVYEKLNYPFFSNRHSSRQYFFHQWFNDTIYQFDVTDPASFRPAFVLDFGAQHLSVAHQERLAALPSTVEKMFYLNGIHDQVRRLERIGYCQNRLFARVSCWRKPYLIQIDLSNQSVQIFQLPTRPVSNDFDLLPVLPIERAFYEDGMVFLLSAHKIGSLLEEVDVDVADQLQLQRFAKVKHLLQSTERDANPVLILAKMKD